MIAVEAILPVIHRSAAWDWMRRRYLPAGPVCGCGVAITGDRALAAWQDGRVVYCSACGKRSAATTGTPIQSTSWQPEEYLQLLVLLAAGRSADKIAAVLGKSAACVRDMVERIRLIHPEGRA